MVGALSYQAARQPSMRGVPALRRYAGGGGVEVKLGGYNSTPVPGGSSNSGGAPQGALSLIAGEDPNQDMTDRIQALRDAREILAAGNGHQPITAANPITAPSPAPPLPVLPMPPGYDPTQDGGGMAMLPPPQDQGASLAAPPPAGPSAAPPSGDGLPTVNIPMLKFAAGMLKGGHPGGFGADLGSGFEEAGTALQNQRQLEESTRLRRAQQMDTAAYRQAMADASTTRADAYANRNDLIKNKNDQAYQVAMLRALNRQGDESWTYAGTNPDGLPILLNSRNGETKIGAVPIGAKPSATADVAQARLAATQDQRKWAQQNKVTDSEMRQTLEFMKQTNKLDFLGKPVGTPISLDDALKKIRGVRSPQPASQPENAGQPPAAPSGAAPPPVSSFFQ